MQRHKCMVAHSLKSWLPQTEAWQFNQIASLTNDISNLIVCDYIDTSGKFGQPENAAIECMRNRISLEYLLREVLARGMFHSDQQGTTATSRFYAVRQRAATKGGFCAAQQDITSTTRLHPPRVLEKCAYYLQDKERQRFLIMQIKKYGARVLHSHFGNRGWLNASIARKAKVKHIVSFYGSDLGFLPQKYPEWRHRYKQLFGSVDAVLVEGPHMANHIIGMGCPEERVLIHHLGVKVDEIAFRSRWKHANEPLRVLIAASFREKKGIVYAVEALKRLNRACPVIVTIVGNDNGTPQSLREKQKIIEAINSDVYDASDIEKLSSSPAIMAKNVQPMTTVAKNTQLTTATETARFNAVAEKNARLTDGAISKTNSSKLGEHGEESFKDRVRMVGYLTHHDLIQEAYKHHVFMSPSVTASDGDIEGGAPVTLIEMAATGIVALSTRHCDIPGVIQNGKSGFLVDERDVEGLVDRLRWINDNPAEWGRIANEARSHIERKFNALTQGESLACIYKKLAGV